MTDPDSDPYFSTDLYYAAAGRRAGPRFNRRVLMLAVALRRLNKRADGVTQSERERTKRVVYSIMYGVGTSSL